jgi:Trp operon repressor
MDDLTHLMSHLHETADFQQFQQVFLTENERVMLQERIAIFRELSKGASQRDVASRIGCSVVTVTRGAKAYRENRAVIDKWLVLLGWR